MLKIQSMKHLFLLVFILIAGTYSNFGNAQMVTSTNSSSSSACDGTAFFNSYSAYNPPFWSWHWEQDSVQIAGADSMLLNLCPGNYTLVLDSMGIPNYSEPFVIGDLCNGFTGFITTTPSSGPAICDGSAMFNAINGTTPYSYTWSNGAVTHSITNQCAGNYTVTCTDAAGCTITATGTIVDTTTTMPPLVINLTSSDDLTNSCSGSASVSPTGSSGVYFVEWSNGQTTNSITTLCPGVYSVLVWSTLYYDSTLVSFVIADSSSTYNNNPYPNGAINDTLYTDLVTNCIIDYSDIDSASLYQAVYNSSNQSLYVTWAVYSPTDTVYISDTLALIGNPGYYALTISVFCPNKSGNDFMKINGVIYFDGTAVHFSTLGVDEHLLDNVSVYPNPFSSFISIDNKDGVIQSMKLMDLNGRTISEINSLNSGMVKMEQLESVSSGTYLLILSGENSSKAYKVIK